MGLCRSSLAALIATAMLVGCGASAQSPAHRASRQQTITDDVPSVVPPAGTPQNEQGLRIPTPGPTGIRARGQTVAVIRAWANALRHGDLARAARYFALPSVMIYGPAPGGGVLASSIQNRAAAVTANAALPCGAALISADQRGRYVNALFRLTSRGGPGGGCSSGTGQTARTNFLIAHGLIVKWIRAPDDAGDNSGQPPSAHSHSGQPPAAHSHSGGPPSGHHLPGPVTPGPPLPAQPATPVA